MVSHASRTPEGQPLHCQVCGKDVTLEPTYWSGDATCPYCGSLVWGQPGLAQSASSATIEETKRRIKLLVR